MVIPVITYNLISGNGLGRYVLYTIICKLQEIPVESRAGTWLSAIYTEEVVCLGNGCDSDVLTLFGLGNFCCVLTE